MEKRTPIGKKMFKSAPAEIKKITDCQFCARRRWHEGARGQQQAAFQLWPHHRKGGIAQALFRTLLH
jgi:hypothetical protein